MADPTGCYPFREQRQVDRTSLVRMAGLVRFLESSGCRIEDAGSGGRFLGDATAQ